MQNKKYSRSGFTLFELVLYIGIFAIIGTLAGSVFNFTLRGKVAVGGANAAGGNLSKAMLQIIDRVHSSLTINDASSTLNLKMSDSTKNPTIIGLSSGAITLKEGAGAAQSLTPSSTLTVTALTFTLITNPSPSTSSVQILITGGYNNNGTIDQGTVMTLRTSAMPL